MRTKRTFGGWAARGAAWAVAGLAAIAGVALLLPPVRYLARQSFAHLRVLAAREPVDDAIAAGKVPEAWLPGLETIRDARRFGAEALGLPTADLYGTISLAKVGPTWIVTACPQDALRPVTWWFPVVGRVAYKGYYNKEGAEGLAARLREEGNDVLVYPAPAFSTLGWFADPIRPSMLDGDDEELANLVLHEAAHRVLYWKGETDFNESFASFVGDVGAVRYLEATRGEGCDPCRRAIAARRDAPRFGALVERVAERLEALYAEPIPRDEKIRRRREVFAWAKEEYGREGFADAYDHFLRRELNNAVLLSYRRYGSGQEAFDRALERCGGDLPAAMRFVQAIGWPALPRTERRATTPLALLERRLLAGAACDARAAGSPG
jgi:predicted aminopeptidase